MSKETEEWIVIDSTENSDIYDFLPGEIEIECPYGDERKANLFDCDFELNWDIESAAGEVFGKCEFGGGTAVYECRCDRGDVDRHCEKNIKLFSLFKKKGIVTKRA